jgi:uncharacterized membrane protein YgaE (UPF0421/DUF939 family)
MLMLIFAILIIGAFAKFSKQPSTPFWLVYLLKTVTIIMLMYIVYVALYGYVEPKIALLFIGMLGGLLVVIMFINHRKYIQKKLEAQKKIDEIGA